MPPIFEKICKPLIRDNNSKKRYSEKCFDAAESCADGFLGFLKLQIGYLKGKEK